MPKRETPVTDVIQLAQKLVRFQSFGGQIEPVFDYLHAALSGMALTSACWIVPKPVLLPSFMPPPAKEKAVCCLPDILTLLLPAPKPIGKTGPLPEK